MQGARASLVVVVVVVAQSSLISRLKRSARAEVYFPRLQTFVRKWRYFSIATYFGTVENSNYVWSSPVYAYTLLSSMADCVRGPPGPGRVGPGTREVPREP